ncbi:MAG: ribonuclease H-like domain-containing protein [Thermodesulfovibrionales bacterium]|nr:ribonuclease H-like domain-containing protein [Thermodesulfovibrionales bacterium]
MNRVIFDIETVGDDFDSLDPSIQSYFLRWIDKPEEEEKIKETLSFYPHTAQIIALGMLNPDTNRGRVYFQSPDQKINTFEEDDIVYQSASEREILTEFWNTIISFDRFITFNGRRFECPFIQIRSAVHRLKPTRDLITNKYSDVHIDLLDQLTFFGTTKRRFSLDIWCRTFNIQSPKAEGITGQNVKALFKDGKYLDIARYCVRDLRATRELFFIWEKYIKFQPSV